MAKTTGKRTILNINGVEFDITGQSLSMARLTATSAVERMGWAALPQGAEAVPIPNTTHVRTPGPIWIDTPMRASRSLLFSDRLRHGCDDTAFDEFLAAILTAGKTMADMNALPIDEAGEALVDYHQAFLIRLEQIDAHYIPKGMRVTRLPRLWGWVAGIKGQPYSVMRVPYPFTLAALQITLHECGHVAHEHWTLKNRRRANHAIETEAEQWSIDVFEREGIVLPRRFESGLQEYIFTKIVKAVKAGAKRIDRNAFAFALQTHVAQRYIDLIRKECCAIIKDCGNSDYYRVIPI